MLRKFKRPKVPERLERREGSRGTVDRPHSGGRQIAPMRSPASVLRASGRRSRLLKTLKGVWDARQSWQKRKKGQAILAKPLFYGSGGRERT